MSAGTIRDGALSESIPWVMVPRPAQEMTASAGGVERLADVCPPVAVERPDRGSPALLLPDATWCDKPNH
jgi:hypothetical protein